MIKPWSFDFLYAPAAEIAADAASRGPRPPLYKTNIRFISKGYAPKRRELSVRPCRILLSFVFFARA